MISNEIFIENMDTFSESIVLKIKKGEWEDIFKGLCYINDNSIVLDYKYFKHFAVKETYSLILNYISNQFDNVLTNNQNFIIHINMKNLTISDIDKHKLFIQNMSTFFKEKYPNKLSKCYVYNAPFVFSQIYNIVSIFIDRDTQQKIELVSTRV